MLTCQSSDYPNINLYKNCKKRVGTLDGYLEIRFPRAPSDGASTCAPSGGMLSGARDAVRHLRTVSFNVSGVRRRGCSLRRCCRACSDALHGRGGNGCSSSTAMRPRRLRPGEAAARVDVAEMDTDPKLVQHSAAGGGRRRGTHVHCVHRVNARSATSGGVETLAIAQPF
jgi:hypothetical protein